MHAIPDLYSYTDFRDNMPAHFKRLKKAKRPTIVTQKGKAAAVVMSPEAYEQLAEAMELARSRHRLRESLRQVREGKFLPVDEAFAEVRRRVATGRNTKRRKVG